VTDPADDPAVVAVGPGVYHVTWQGRRETVYVAGEKGDLWAFCRGRVYRPARPSEAAASPATRVAATSGSTPRSSANRTAAVSHTRVVVSAPMPATVLAVEVAPGDRVRKGATIVLLEAMKMELPVRATLDGVVRAVHCRKGEIVKPDAPLVELDPMPAGHDDPPQPS
jgi:biotin carboxyl carrier protein